MKDQNNFTDNYEAYTKGKEPLKFAFRKPNDQIFNMIKNSTKKRFWTLPKLYEEGEAMPAETNATAPSNPTPPQPGQKGTADFGPGQKEGRKSKYIKPLKNMVKNFNNFCKSETQ